MSTTDTPSKKLRFRGNQNVLHNRIDELNPNESGWRKQTHLLHTPKKDEFNASASVKQQQNGDAESSFFDFFKIEMTRGYTLQHDEERYSARRQKVYSFMRIPRDLERFIIYGLMQCADSFLYIHTFLPVRFVMALWALITRIIAKIFRLGRGGPRLLMPAEICDLLKCSIWISVTLIMLYVDTNRVYHIIKSQSIIKLYIFYNMLEVGDRLLSAFGQDTIDALFWTATEPKDSKRQHFGLFPHLIFAYIYFVLHSVLIMFQATALNVAVNSNNKGLLTIMTSNNFVELKGSVFKKFDKNNLFQLTCSDVRERFHITVLLFIVMIQTMKEFDWSFMQFCTMLPDCAAVLITEILIDWVKHAFITRFNELPESIYREYTTSLAYDMTQTRQKHAFSDHSDLVARRMGFIPFPLAVVLIKAIYSAVSFHNFAAFLLFALAFVFVLGLRICLTVCALGKACKLMKEHQDERSNSSPNSMTNVAPSSTTAHTAIHSPIGSDINFIHFVTPNKTPTSHAQNIQRSDVATSPISTPEVSPDATRDLNNDQNSTSSHKAELDVTNSLELGATALFSNSDVDLDDVCLNEHVLEGNTSIASTTNGSVYQDEECARSEPHLQLIGPRPSGKSTNKNHYDGSAAAQNERCKRLPDRTHKRSESEPSIQSIVADLNEMQS